MDRDAIIALVTIRAVACSVMLLIAISGTLLAIDPEKWMRRIPLLPHLTEAEMGRPVTIWSARVAGAVAAVVSSCLALTTWGIGGRPVLLCLLLFSYLVPILGIVTGALHLIGPQWFMQLAPERYRAFYELFPVRILMGLSLVAISALMLSSMES